MDSNEDRDDVQTRMSPAEMVAALEQFEARIPDFGHLTNDQIIALRRVATLDPDWVDLAVIAVGASPTVEVVLGETYDALRNEIDDIYRWGQVEQQLRGMLKGIMNANLVRRHRVGLKALQAYGIIRQLIRQPEHRNELLSHYEKLKQMNKLGKRKKKTEEPPDTPVTE
jgi:hypothetical protein